MSPTSAPHLRSGAPSFTVPHPPTRNHAQHSSSGPRGKAAYHPPHITLHNRRRAPPPAYHTHAPVAPWYAPRHRTAGQAAQCQDRSPSGAARPLRPSPPPLDGRLSNAYRPKQADITRSRFPRTSRHRAAWPAGRPWCGRNARAPSRRPPRRRPVRGGTGGRGPQRGGGGQGKERERWRGGGVRYSSKWPLPACCRPRGAAGR